MDDHQLITLSQDRQQVMLNAYPRQHYTLTPEDIQAAIKAAGVAHYFPQPREIEFAVQELARRNKANEDKLLVVAVAERMDAQLAMDISTDLMEANLILTSPWGGKPAELIDVLKLLKQQQVARGILKLNIDQLLQQSKDAAPGTVCSGMVARGRPALHGRDAKNLRKVPLARERLLKPMEREDGTVDLRDLGKVTSVAPGDVLMVKRPYSDGYPGYNLKAETLPAIPGKDIDLIPGPGTKLDLMDSSILVADMAGMPLETPNGMQVDEVLMLQDVDPANGHVEFRGSVMIRGDIKEGMKVIASGDICVQGLVQSAMLEAGGDIIVNQGILGRQNHSDHSLPAQLTARGQICSPFVQYASLNAGGDIIITRQLLHSQVVTQGGVIVCDRFGKRGDIIGGTIKANAIKAVTLGADASTFTAVECDDQREMLKQEIKELEVEQQTMVLRKVRLDNQLKQKPAKNASSEARAKYDQQHKDHLMTVAELNELVKRLDALKHKLENYFDIHNIQVRRSIFPNVQITMGKVNHRTNRIHGNATIRVQDKEIAFDYQSKPNFTAPA